MTTDDLFGDLLAVQDLFLTELWGPKYNLTLELDKIPRTRTVALALMTELAEFLDELPIKEHRIYTSTESIQQYNLAEEIVDILKYLLGLALLWGISKEQLAEVWVAKSQVVMHRLHQERLLDNMARRDMAIAILDLDGVLLDSHRHWLKFLEDRTGNVFSSRQEARATLGTVWYEALKDVYRRWFKADIPRMAGARTVTRQLHETGYGVIIVTARPYSRYSNLWVDTEKSMEGMYWDALFFDDDKRSRIGKYASLVSVVVEDDPKHAITLLNPWTKVYLITNEENREAVLPSQIKRVDSLASITREVDDVSSDGAE